MAEHTEENHDQPHPEPERDYRAEAEDALADAYDELNGGSVKRSIADSLSGLLALAIAEHDRREAWENAPAVLAEVESFGCCHAPDVTEVREDLCPGCPECTIDPGPSDAELNIGGVPVTLNPGMPPIMSVLMPAATPEEVAETVVNAVRDAYDAGMAEHKHRAECHSGGYEVDCATCHENHPDGVPVAHPSDLDLGDTLSLVRDGRPLVVVVVGITAFDDWIAVSEDLPYRFVLNREGSWLPNVSDVRLRDRGPHEVGPEWGYVGRLNGDPRSAVFARRVPEEPPVQVPAVDLRHLLVLARARWMATMSTTGMTDAEKALDARVEALLETHEAEQRARQS